MNAYNQDMRDVPVIIRCISNGHWMIREEEKKKKKKSLALERVEHRDSAPSSVN